MKEKTFEELVQNLDLKVVEIIEDTAQEPIKKFGFVGFENFKAAYDASRIHRKRLEVISRKQGSPWQRLHVTTFCNLDIFSVLDDANDKDNRYKICHSKDEYSKVSSKILKNIIDSGGTAKEYAAFSDEIDATKKLFKKGLIGFNKGFIVFDLVENKQYGPIVNDTKITFQDSEIAICLMDVEEGTAEKLAPRVYAGDVIPCLIGQMPEDFIGLIPKRISSDNRMFVYDNFSADNMKSSDNDLMLGPFIVFDSNNNIGYAYRNSYDNKIWRWESLAHTNIWLSEFTDLEDHEDQKIIGWSLPPYGVQFGNKGQFVSDAPVPYVPETNGMEEDVMYYKQLADSRLSELESLKQYMASNEALKSKEEQIKRLQSEVKSLNAEKHGLLDRCILAETDRDDYKRKLEQSQSNASSSTPVNKGIKTFCFNRSLRNVVINNGEIWINGQRVTNDDKGNVFVNDANYDIHVEGNVDSIKTQSGDVTVSGSTGSISTASGDVEVGNNVQGSISTASGDITVRGSVTGNCSTMSGIIRR